MKYNVQGLDQGVIHQILTFSLFKGKIPVNNANTHQQRREITFSLVDKLSRKKTQGIFILKIVTVSWNLKEQNFKHNIDTNI